MLTTHYISYPKIHEVMSALVQYYSISFEEIDTHRFDYRKTGFPFSSKAYDVTWVCLAIKIIEINFLNFISP